MDSLFTTVAAVGLLTSALAALLIAANRRLFVADDPRVETVEAMLPATNCGACGQPGCHAFAEALVAGAAQPAGCSVGSSDDHAAIASFLGVSVGSVQRRVARLACAGGDNVARNRAHYTGLSTCAAAAVVAGGGKGCFWGCLGLGDCANVCDFDALHMSRNALPVVDADNCTACGDCVAACPKDLFSLVPVRQPLWVACKSLEAGDDALADCDVACTACGKCAMDAPAWVSMRDNLPVVHDLAPDGQAPPGRAAIERCPTGAIVWLDARGGLVRGAAAAPVVRQQSRAAAIS